MKEWVWKIFPDDKDEFSENNVYLVGNVESLDDLKEWIQKNYERIFENELNEWHLDETTWPENRTFQLFNDWFEIDYFTLVYDTEPEDILK
jgi:hypothetical protein